MGDLAWIEGWERFYMHRPRYHHGLSKAERIEQVTGDWVTAYYGRPYAHRRIPCYGLPRDYGWTTKDRVDGPRRRNWKRYLRRLMRKRARKEGKAWIAEMREEA